MRKFLNKILVIDGSYQIQRCLHAPNLSDLKTSKGDYSGGIYGFLRILQSEIRNNPGYYPIVLWDAGQAQRRLDIYPDYKHNIERSTVPVDPGTEQYEFLQKYRTQRGVLIEILEALGIPNIRIKGWEGDDLQYIITLCSNDCVVLTDDKDLIQLVAPNVRISRPMNKQVIDYNTCEDYYKYPQFIIAKSIVGDPSDNIPKVAQGVGGKSAEDISKLLKDYHTKDYSRYKEGLEAIINNESVAKSVRSKTQKVLDNFDQFMINMKLTDLQLVDIPNDIENIITSSIITVLGKPNFFKAQKYLADFEITTIDLNKIISSILPYSMSTIVKS